MGPQIGLRSLAAATTTLRIYAFGGVLLVVGTAAGIAIAGIGGAAYGMALASAVIALIWWWRLWHRLAALPEYRGEVIPG
jgi:hypothetical protein